MTDSQQQRARRSILSLFGVQLFTKIINFSLNLVLIKKTGRKLLGIGAVPLALLLSTVQSLSRDGVRGACRRINLNDEGLQAHERRRRLAWIVNLSWATLAAATFVIGPCAVCCLSSVSYEGVSYKVYMGFALAAVVEMIAEPAFNVTIAFECLHIKALVEGAGVTCKALTTLIGVVVFQLGPEVYAYAQMAYSLVQLLGYYLYVVNGILPSVRNDANVSIGMLFPGEGSHDHPGERSHDQQNSTLGNLFGSQSYGNALALSAQNIVKWVLTEGDKMILVLAKNRAEKYYSGALPSELKHMDAVYGVVFNLGSLLGRLVLEPVETQSRVQFSKLAAFYNKTTEAKTVKERSEAQNSYLVKWRNSLSSFSFRLRILLTIAGIIVSFGPPYTWHLLRLIEGREKYSTTDAPRVLAWYCLYVLLMALNGMLEALRDAVATHEQLASRSPLGLTGFMLITFVLSSAVAFYSVPVLGSLGIVMANSLNLLMRAIFSAHFIVYRGVTPEVENTEPKREVLKALQKAIPSRNIMLACSVSFITMNILTSGNPAAKTNFRHVINFGIGVLFGIWVVLFILIYDHDLRAEIKGVLGGIPRLHLLIRLLNRFDGPRRILREERKVT